MKTRIWKVKNKYGNFIPFRKEKNAHKFLVDVAHLVGSYKDITYEFEDVDNTKPFQFRDEAEDEERAIDIQIESKIEDDLKKRYEMLEEVD